MTTPGPSRRPPARTWGSAPAPLDGWRYQRHLLSSRSILETSSPTRGSSCSALGAGVNRHLLWPLLTSDGPSRRLSTPVAPWQITRPPRVRRATFLPYARRLYYRPFRIAIGLRVSWPSRPGATASYAVPVRRATSLPTASSRFRLATDTLAVQLTVPAIRVRRGLSPPSHPEAPPSGTAPVRRCAPCLAHQKNAPARGRGDVLSRARGLAQRTEHHSGMVGSKMRLVMISPSLKVHSPKVPGTSPLLSKFTEPEAPS